MENDTENAKDKEMLEKLEESTKRLCIEIHSVDTKSPKLQRALRKKEIQEAENLEKYYEEYTHE